MNVVGHDELGRPVFSIPHGLETLDFEDILRHRYLGVFGDAPSDHLLGGSDDITFGGNGGETGECWRRIKVREKPREARLWQDAYHEIGRICSWLGLPTYVREEMTRIYANLRAVQKTMRVKIEKQLAKIAYLACIIHRIPRERRDIERDIKEFYGHGFGKIPVGFVKAANYKYIRFRTKREKNGIEYLRRYELRTDGKMANEMVLSKL